jgi:amino acid transporter
MGFHNGGPDRSLATRVKEFVIGAAKNPLDVRIFHTTSLIAVLAWIGMGADGLTSSCYGPEAAYLALGKNTCLTLPLAALVALAVFMIAASYIQIIEQFAHTGAGGGYLVATRFLGPAAGVVSGSALVVDYILTISVSIASSADAFFSLLPLAWQPWKLWMALVLVGLLFVLNLRGIKESVTTLAPIFLVFVLTHLAVILHGILQHGNDAPHILYQSSSGTNSLIQQVGAWGTLLILMRAFSLGGGTYTGLEAVSNGIPVLREPRALTGKRTMTYMAFSLAFTASGLLLAYLIHDIHLEAGRTMNASLFHHMWEGWRPWGLPVGDGGVVLGLLSEAALLIVGAQAGFIDGPRVLASMASDSWAPRRFANLSDRLVNQDGIVFMAVSAAVVIFLTRARVEVMVIIYSINVFITFTLSQLGMCRHWLEVRQRGERWLRPFIVNGAGLIMTMWILVFTAVIKIQEGAWPVFLLTGAVIGGCVLVKSHYRRVSQQLRKLDDLLTTIHLSTSKRRVPRKNVAAPTAVLMVSGYNGLGIHTMFSILKLFPKRFKNVVFVEVGTIDSSQFKGLDAIHHLEETVKNDLEKYLDLGRRLGFHAEYRYALNVDRLEALEGLCGGVANEFRDTVFFVGKLVFERETWTSALLHSQTALSIQKSLLFNGYQAIVMPIRVRG